MESTEIANILDQLLGKGKDRKGNRIYFCPFCNHYKPKLEIHLTNGYYQCWVCGVSGKSIYTLLKKINAGKDYYEKLSVLNKHPKTTTSQQQVKLLSLPKEFIPLTVKNNSFERPHVLHYLLEERGLTVADIAKYNIGFSINGQYRNRLIVPSYDVLGNLNYFITRTYRETEYKGNPYINPDTSKDVVGFELFINWSLPIIICEGVFDAFAIRHNAIPLFGKLIPELLKTRIIENDVQDIYICLDEDAKKEALKHCQLFMSQGRNVYFVELQGKDPSKIGYMKMWEIIRNTKKLNFSSLIKYKIK